MKIRSDILRIYLSLHTWTGILAGLLLFIGFFAGALTVFKQPLTQWSTPPSQYLPAVTPAQADSLIQQTLQQFPQAGNDMLLSIGRNAAVAPLYWTGKPASHELDLESRPYYASLTAHGELQVQQQEPAMLATLIDILHRTGGIPGEIGDDYAGGYLMGIAGGLYFLALVSGLIIFLPVLVKDLFALRPGKNLKRFWQDAHNLLGIFSLPFHLIISLTVVVFAFHDLLYGSLGKFVYGEHPMFTPPAKVRHQTTVLQPVSVLIQKAKQLTPDFEVTELRYMRLGKPGAVVRLALENPAYVVRGAHAAYLVLNPYTGAVVNDRMLPGHGSVWNAMVDPLFSLHFASYGGNLMRWVYLLAGLSGAMLFYTGNLLWLEKRRKQAVSRDGNPAGVQQTRSVRYMGSLTVGCALGSIAGVGLCMLAAKWLPVFGIGRNTSYLPLYYLSFAASCICAFSCGPARSAVWLCRSIAAICVAIPLTSLLALCLPGCGLWASNDLTTVTIDVFALFVAIFFFILARHSRHRGAQGQLHSIWSDQKAA